MKPSDIAGVAALVILLVWAALALSTLVTHQIEPLTVVTPVMLAVAYALFGIKRNGNGKP